MGDRFGELCLHFDVFDRQHDGLAGETVCEGAEANVGGAVTVVGPEENWLVRRFALICAAVDMVFSI